MIYDKPSLTFEEQADRLLSRGLVADRPVLVQRLASVNYYRLSGYLHTFRQLTPDGQRVDSYYPGTRLDEVWDRYRFDRQLRLLVLDAVERFEVSLKTQLTQSFSHLYGPFGYLDRASLPRLSPERHQDFLRRVKEETDRSSDEFVKHFFAKYGDQHTHLPLWMAVEVMSFGTALTLFHGMKEAELKPIARTYGVPLPVLNSWIVSLSGVRNICAHHARLWNRVLGARPMIPWPESGSVWHSPVATPNDRVFGVLTILKFLLNRVAPQSEWPQRLKSLLAAHPAIPTAFMGFPPEWQNHGVWR